MFNVSIELTRKAERCGRREEFGPNVERVRDSFRRLEPHERCAAADLIPAPGSGHFAWGVLYETSQEGLKRLREVEGSSYEEKRIRVQTLAGEEEATTFLVKSAKREFRLWTSAKYVGYIVRGLREHKISEEYTQHVLDIAILTNKQAKDWRVAEEQARLVEELRTP